MLAFSEVEGYTPSIITTADILEAQSRYLKPILGEELLEALLDGSYPDLATEYVEVALAAYVRYLIEPLLEVRSSSSLGEAVTTASNHRVEMCCEAQHRKADALRRRLSDYLNANAEAFAEYNPENNPLNRCLIYGNIVQTF